MAKIIRLTERDLTRLVKRVIKEQGAIPEPDSKPFGGNPIQQSPNNQGKQGPVGQGENQEYIINNLDDLSKVIYQMVNIGGKGRIQPVNGTSWAFNGVGSGWYIRLKKDDGSTITFTKK